MSLANKLIFNATHGKEDPERGSLPFVAGNVAATAGQEAIVFCTIEAVWLGTKGGTDGIDAKGLDPLSKIYSDFITRGERCGSAEPVPSLAGSLRDSWGRRHNRGGGEGHRRDSLGGKDD